MAKGLAPSAADTTSVEEIDARSVDLNTLPYQKCRLIDYEDGVHPELPVGLFLPREDGSIERLTSFEVNPDAELGAYSLLLNAWEGRGRTAEKAPDILANFLAGKQPPNKREADIDPVITSIGGIPIKEIPKRYGDSLVSMFKNMYVADIATILFSTRMEILGREVAIEMDCPAANCTQTVRDIQSLNSLEFIYYTDLQDKPLFRLELPKGFSDGKGKISKVYLEPLKASQLYIFDNQAIGPFDLLVSMIAKIPESEVYGKVRGKPFCSELWARCGQKDQNAMIEALQLIQPGPRTSFEFTCPCGRQKIPYAIQWILNASDFLYYSASLSKEL